MDIEDGEYVRIPKILSQRDLPHSFQFYDHIGHFTESKITHEKRIDF